MAHANLVKHEWKGNAIDPSECARWIDLVGIYIDNDIPPGACARQWSAVVETADARELGS
jgi:hypothetical protein